MYTRRRLLASTFYPHTFCIPYQIRPPPFLLFHYHDILMDWRWLLFYFNTYHLRLYSSSLLIVFAIPGLSLSLCGYPAFRY